MHKLLLKLLAIGLVFTPVVRGQSISGTWQGTIQSTPPKRMVLTVEKDRSGQERVLLYRIDAPGHERDAHPMSSFTVHGSKVKFIADMGAGSYNGKISADHSSIVGTWLDEKPSPLTFVRVKKNAAWSIDTGKHKKRFVEVEKGIRLEVLDWGGTGRPLVLIPGLSDTAHVFDDFAPALAKSYHVYGITPRGAGESSSPSPTETNYNADRLGDDVVAVIDALRLNKPLLAGHSYGGAILSSVGTRFPDKISGLIYIDAGYQYALYDEMHGDLVIDALELRNTLEHTHLGQLPRAPEQISQILEKTKQFEAELQQRHNDLATVPSPHPIQSPILDATLDGERKYTKLNVPVLAIFNVPHSAAFRRTMEEQVQAFQRQVPQTKIVLIANADHFLFEVKEQDVLDAINAFVDGLAAHKP